MDTANKLQRVMQAAMAATEPVEVPFEDVVLRVLPPLDWTNEATEAITRAQFAAWGRGALINDVKVVDGKVTGQDDPSIFAKFTQRQTIAFFEAYADRAGGQSPGE